PARSGPRRAARHRRHPAPGPHRGQVAGDRADGHRPALRRRRGTSARHHRRGLRSGRRRRLPREDPGVRPPVLPAEQGGPRRRPHQAVRPVGRRDPVRVGADARARTPAAALPGRGCQGGAGRLPREAHPGLQGAVTRILLSWSNPAKAEKYREALAAAAAGPITLLDADGRAVDPEPAVGALAGADGLLLTGGPDVEPERYGEGVDPEAGVDSIPTRDALEWRLLEEARERRLPVLAIC